MKTYEIRMKLTIEVDAPDFDQALQIADRLAHTAHTEQARLLEASFLSAYCVREADVFTAACDNGIETQPQSVG